MKVDCEIMFIAWCYLHIFLGSSSATLSFPEICLGFVLLPGIQSLAYISPKALI